MLGVDEQVALFLLENDPEACQELFDGLDIDEIGDIGEGCPALRQQGGGNRRQGGILGAAVVYLPDEPPAAGNDYLVHG